MEYSPPPLFKQGASARLKVIVFAILAITLLAVDSRVRSLGAIRHAVGVALYPLQMAALAPRDAAYAVGKYFYTLTSVQRENDELRRMHISNALQLQQSQHLNIENAHLRELLGASARLPVKSLMADILYDTRDPFTRKIVLDRGSQHMVTAGQPVIDNVGVIGQVTRVFPLTSEVTLLTDKAQAIPVQVQRSGVRSLVYGRGQSNLLDLRFVPANADIVEGDVLVTSGIDGVYPAGLAVARVAQVESQYSDAFARIVCVPIAGVARNRQLLILLAEPGLPARSEQDEVSSKNKHSGKRAAAGAQGAVDATGAAVPAAAAAAVTGAAVGATSKPPPGAGQSPAADAVVSRSTPAKGAPAKGAPAKPVSKPAASRPAPPNPGAVRPGRDTPTTSRESR